jgi:hypothetical protein
MSRSISQLRGEYPQIVNYSILSPISEVGFFPSHEMIEPHKDLSQLTHMASGRRPLYINTSVFDFGQPNEFLSPSSLLAPFQNANLNSPLECGDASEALKDPQSFMRWFNPPL